MFQYKFNLQLGVNVRKIREELTMTRTTLSEVSGVNEKYIGKIERGECSASLYIIKKISLGLNIQLSDLLRGL
jgi:transcriptional regulator with XRE-family HTH domain